MQGDVRLTRELESLLMGQGADLVGVAPIERFHGAPEGHRPQEYMPEASCVVSYGIHLQDGICDVWGDYSQPGKSISPYLFYGYGLVNLELGRMANMAAKHLEYRGYKSLTFPPTWNISLYRWHGLHDGEIKADFSHRHAAVAAGLAQFGWNGLALTPVFGARVRFNSIITSAPLAATPMYQGAPLCLPEQCRKLCTRECPTQAYSDTETREVDIAGHRFQYAKLDFIRCQYGILGLVKGSGSIAGVEIPPGPGVGRHLRESMAKQRGPDKDMIDTCFGIICGNFCGRCLHQCPAHIYWKTGAGTREQSEAGSGR